MEDQKTLRGGCFIPSIYAYAKIYNYSVSRRLRERQEKGV